MAPIPKFDYHKPATVEEAVSLLVKYGPHARPMLGGTDLIGKMRADTLNVDHIVSLNHIAELAGITWDDAKGLRIGARTTIHSAQQHEAVHRHYPELAHACSVHSTNQIRNMATVVGNIANGSPCADTAGPLLCRDANAEIIGLSGNRSIPITQFFRGPGEVELEPGEIVTAIVVPPPVSGMHAEYMRMSARSCVDIAAASATAMLKLGPDGMVEQIRLALGSVAPVPLRLHDVEALVTGKVLDDSRLRQLVTAGTRAASPIDDVRGSAEYRRTLISVMLFRTLRQCIGANQGGAQ